MNGHLLGDSGCFHVSSESLSQIVSYMNFPNLFLLALFSSILLLSQRQSPPVISQRDSTQHVKDQYTMTTFLISLDRKRASSILSQLHLDHIPCQP